MDRKKEKVRSPALRRRPTWRREKTRTKKLDGQEIYIAEHPTRRLDGAKTSSRGPKPDLEEHPNCA